MQRLSILSLHFVLDDVSYSRHSGTWESPSEPKQNDNYSMQLPENDNVVYRGPVVRAEFHARHLYVHPLKR